jgi:hypothetical protein
LGLLGFGAPRYIPSAHPAASLAYLVHADVVTDGTKKAADKILQAAQAIAPVGETGDLRDSGHVNEIEGGHEVVFDVPYAVYVEFGTSDTPTFAFLRKGVEAAGYSLG